MTTIDPPLWEKQAEGYEIRVLGAYTGHPDYSYDEDAPPCVIVYEGGFDGTFELGRLDAFLADLQAAREVLVKALQEERKEA